MKSVPSTLEEKVRGIQNWINAIGFDNWIQRDYRSLELLGGMSSDAFKPDQYRPDVIRRMCNIVVHNRELLVLEEIRAKAHGLSSGRLLGHRFGETTCTAEPTQLTSGFLDCYDVPPWDTWVEFVEDDELAKREGAYMVAWIPDETVEGVSRAIKTSFEENLFWLGEGEGDITTES